MSGALDVAAFADRVLGQPLWPHQQELVESTAFISVVAAARRVGKSTTAEILAIYTAFSTRNCKVVILSAAQDSSRRITEGIAQRLASSPITRGAVVDDFATRVTLSNGSEIISLPASQRQVRGLGKGVRLLVIDEASMMPNELWQAASYIALDEKANGSRVLMMGTPWGDGFFRRAYRAGEDGDPDYRSFHWTYKANPDLDHSYLERQRERVAPFEFATEIEGRWTEATGSLFSRALLDRQTADVVIPPLASLQRPALGVLALDWGASYDLSSAVALFRLPVAALNPDERPLPRFICWPYVWPVGTSLNDVVDEAADATGAFRYICAETNGIGAMPSTELHRRVVQRNDRQRRKWNLTATTAGSKTAAYGMVLALLDRNQLVLPRHPGLLRQLAGLQFRQGERGFARIEASDAAAHDDIADALMLAMLPHRPSGAKRVLCHTAELAGHSRAPADARAPELDCPVVQTGGGLRVPQRPTLQSVAGTDFSVYAPLAQTRPEGFRAGRFFIKTDKQGVIDA